MQFTTVLTEPITKLIICFSFVEIFLLSMMALFGT